MHGTKYFSKRDHITRSFFFFFHVSRPLVSVASLLSVSLWFFFPFEITQAYIERWFALRTTPTCMYRALVTYAVADPGKPDPPHRTSFRHGVWLKTANISPPLSYFNCDEIVMSLLAIILCYYDEHALRHKVSNLPLNYISALKSPC